MRWTTLCLGAPPALGHARAWLPFPPGAPEYERVIDAYLESWDRLAPARRCGVSPRSRAM